MLPPRRAASVARGRPAAASVHSSHTRPADGPPAIDSAGAVPGSSGRAAGATRGVACPGVCAGAWRTAKVVMIGPKGMKSVRWKGFAKKTSAPKAWVSRRSAGSTEAVRMTTRMAAQAGIALRWRKSSLPFRWGRVRLSRRISGQGGGSGAASWSKTGGRGRHSRSRAGHRARRGP